MKNHVQLSVLAACAIATVPCAAWAQDLGEGEVQQRYEAALAATLDPAIIGADDPRYIWASEAKVQCGIALGFFKSGTRDETSIAKCNMAYERMLLRPVPPTPVAPPVSVAAPPPQPCPQPQPTLIFFDWDSSVLPSDGSQTLQSVSQNAARCNWRSFTVTGHADRSGSNAYNFSLSERRVAAVVQVLTSLGVPAGSISTVARGEEQPRVPTADDVRETQNRRVEITVR